MRKKRNYKRTYRPDVKYDSVIASRLINYLMKDGNKTAAEKTLYRALEQVEEKLKQNPMQVLEKALENTTPLVEVRSRRVGGANYQVPVEVRPERKFMLSTRWLLAAARSKKGRPMFEKLADEIIAASKNEGDAIKKKLDVHRMAEANRAFAHFAW
ncbi:MAG: 30S ribosomal protein S7 [Candidatus Colwellbacteria bacterium RIFCSPLOWO2_12_FULL_44_13]|uniref:Small ribosomal subunit protein uS7 n=3 Tax=Candidatus Colwelliibacteriota TaxID=1817904 RepID=A0A1G1Z8A8_9BACT|nr:MAG: 30S ribosomal protein S7 [Candidatus Colwellbacteria bacterium RIFCSPHIGHO2_12_FULL_44_17]OGY60286.1 MAG: 30S ribosomal protein S7 [Candidatus Colwellbacteria bacterium RIFCSPLOWO2_02_FULL_44_20b]OGY61529.1 MAG: 30S ribosomal protein S7 [Candidatus Colwellbacteria bacterium RIFCSPLOWO2_12_FULL_44_13]